MELIEVVCPYCLAPITKTIPGAEVRCYRCGKWTKVLLKVEKPLSKTG